MRTKSELLKEAHAFFPDHWKRLCSADPSVSPRATFPTFRKLTFGEIDGGNSTLPDVTFDMLLENGETRKLWAVYKYRPGKLGWIVEGASVAEFKQIIEEFLDCFLGVLMSESIRLKEWNALSD